MAFSQSKQPRRSGLDDGLVKSKKQKKKEQQNTVDDIEQDDTGKSEIQQKPQQAALRIRPGESMFEFRARVDAALPLSGIAKSTKKIAGISDHRVTAHERKLKRLQKGWREEEARIREKEQEERELAEEDEDEQALLWEDKTADLAAASSSKKKKKGKNKKKLLVGEIDNNSEDEFEALKRKRESRKGLHDVVSAPPEFTKVPREIFKVKNGAGAKVGNVPKDVGSLRKREEVAEERRTIIDTYRAMMAAKKVEKE